MVDPSRIVEELFAAHGVVTDADEGWIVSRGDAPAVRVAAYVVGERQNGITVRLDVELALPDGRVLIESFGTVGADEEAATKAALHKFTVNSLHPVLSSLFGVDDDTQINRERWVIAGVAWDVFAGNFGIEHFGGADDSAVPDPPDGLFDVLEARVKARPDDGADVHWLRMFRAQNDGEAMATEVLWDGEPWDAAARAVADLPWPDRRGYYSVREFMVVRRVEATPDRGPRRDARFLEAGVRTLVRRVEAEPDVGDDALQAELIAAGYDPAIAERLVVFAPMGFSSRILHSVGFPTEYRHADDAATAQGSALAREPAFVAAQRVAYGSSREALMAVAPRCAIMNAVNKALDAGSKLEDLELGSPVVRLTVRDGP